MSKIKHNDKKKEEMNFKAEYDSNSSNNEDCFQDENEEIEDYVPNGIKRRQQQKRAFNSNDDSDFNVEPRKPINQRKGKVAAKPKPQPKKPAATSDCDTDEYEEALEKKILKRLAEEEAQSNDDSDCNENVIKRKSSKPNK